VSVDDQIPQVRHIRGVVEQGYGGQRPAALSEMPLRVEGFDPEGLRVAGIWANLRRAVPAAAFHESPGWGGRHESKQAYALLMRFTQKAPPGSSPGGADGSVRGRH
jgi:hypothetical protein